MPSETMRTKAREWLYNADHPNETASQREVDDLATLLDEVRQFGQPPMAQRYGCLGCPMVNGHCPHCGNAEAP